MSKLSCGLHINSKQRQWYRSESSPPPPGWSVSCTWHTISGEPLRHRELLSGITGSVKLHPRRHDSPPNAEAPVHHLNTSVCRFLYDRAVDVSLASWLVDGNPADDQDGHWHEGLSHRKDVRQAPCLIWQLTRLSPLLTFLIRPFS